jgi:hypothetical protein
MERLQFQDVGYYCGRWILLVACLCSALGAFRNAQAVAEQPDLSQALARWHSLDTSQISRLLTDKVQKETLETQDSGLREFLELMRDTADALVDEPTPDVTTRLALASDLSDAIQFLASLPMKSNVNLELCKGLTRMRCAIVASFCEEPAVSEDLNGSILKESTRTFPFRPQAFDAYVRANGLDLSIQEDESAMTYVRAILHEYAPSTRRSIPSQIAEVLNKHVLNPRDALLGTDPLHAATLLFSILLSDTETFLLAGSCSGEAAANVHWADYPKSQKLAWIEMNNAEKDLAENPDAIDSIMAGLSNSFAKKMCHNGSVDWQYRLLFLSTFIDVNWLLNRRYVECLGVPSGPVQVEATE